MEINVCKIKVIGVGGAGNNAVNRMVDAGVKCAEFYAVNTDLQALMLSKVPTENKIQIGKVTTEGLGAGSFPEIGEKAAEEDIKEIEKVCEGTNLLYVTCGMGGGTGTGAAPVIAKAAREKGCMVVGVVSKPFSYEGRKRQENAKKGIANLAKYVDTMIIVPNDKILESLEKNTPFEDALKFADGNLKQAICAISDLIVTPGLINLDFADVKAVIQNQGVAHMGFGRAKGENRVIEAVRLSVSSPMLETTVQGASNILVNITGDKTLSIGEVNQASELIRGVVSPNANIISGANINYDLNDEIIVTIIATGFTGGFNTPSNTENADNQQVQAQNNNLSSLAQETKTEETVSREQIASEEGNKGKKVPPFLEKLLKVK